MPIPPAFAIAIAILASVTVSIAEEIKGILRPIERAIFVSRLTDVGRISECAGRSSTSSKVSASPAMRNMTLPPSTKSGVYR